MEDIFYLTKEGLEKIKREYKNLLLLKQEKINTGTPVAFHSEELDTEFVAFKEDLELMEARINDLEYILQNHQIIEPPEKDCQKIVLIGATVEVDVNGQKDEFSIVGTLEADPNLGKISDESPVGRALIGKKEGETAFVNSQAKTVYKILKVKY